MPDLVQEYTRFGERWYKTRGTGIDGSLTITSGTTDLGEDFYKNYTFLQINVGTVLTATDAHTATPSRSQGSNLVLRIKGALVLNGTIDQDDNGGNGGPGGSSSVSDGAGAGGTGGDAGGSVFIICASITGTGTITSDGENSVIGANAFSPADDGNGGTGGSGNGGLSIFGVLTGQTGDTGQSGLQNSSNLRTGGAPSAKGEAVIRDLMEEFWQINDQAVRLSGGRGGSGGGGSGSTRSSASAEAGGGTGAACGNIWYTEAEADGESIQFSTSGSGNSSGGGGGGAGGGGGVIFILCPSIATGLTITATGGTSSNGSNGFGGDGSAGSGAGGAHGGHVWTIGDAEFATITLTAGTKSGEGTGTSDATFQDNAVDGTAGHKELLDFNSMVYE